MDPEHENRNGEDGRHAELAVSEAERRSGEDQRAALHADDMDRPRANLREASVSALRRRAERRQSSALVAWWGNVERRSGEDRRAPPSGDGIDRDD